MDPKPSLLLTVDRTLWTVIFTTGCVVHLVQGRTSPAGYAEFGKTVLIPALARLWESFVSPTSASSPS